MKLGDVKRNLLPPALPPPASLGYNWHITLYKFECPICWPYTLVYCTSVIYTSNMSHDHHFFLVVRTCKIYSLSKVQVYNTVLLTLISRPYIKSSELTRLVSGGLYSLTNISPSSPIPLPTSSPSNHQATLFLKKPLLMLQKRRQQGRN